MQSGASPPAHPAQGSLQTPPAQTTFGLKLLETPHTRTLQKNPTVRRTMRQNNNYYFKQLSLEPFVTQQEIIRTHGFILIRVRM